MFPYFSPTKYNRQSTFGGEEGVFDDIQQMGTNLWQGFNSNNGWMSHGFKGATSFSALFSTARKIVNKILPGQLNLDLPKQWEGTTEGTYTVTFDLFNTGSVDQMINNRNLCYILAYQNTQSRRNAIITDPVCIYEVKCGDVVHMPAAYMSNLAITNLGNTRSLAIGFNGDDSGVKKIIPEAYRISMTFTSLLQPSRQIMNGLDIGETVEAINSDNDVSRVVEKTATQIFNGKPNNNIGKDFNARAMEVVNQLGNEKDTSYTSAGGDFNI